MPYRFRATFGRNTREGVADVKLLSRLRVMSVHRCWGYRVVS
jgi:hypothetical protein